MQEDWQRESIACHRCHLAIFLSTFQCQVARVWVVQVERIKPMEGLNSMRWPKYQKLSLSLASLIFVVLKATILPETCNIEENMKNIVSRAYLKKVKSQKAMTFKKVFPLINPLKWNRRRKKSIKMCLLWTLTWSHMKNMKYYGYWDGKLVEINFQFALKRVKIYNVNHDNNFPQVWIAFAIYTSTSGHEELYKKYSIHSKMTLTKHLMMFRRICHKITFPHCPFSRNLLVYGFPGIFFMCNTLNIYVYYVMLLSCHKR